MTIEKNQDPVWDEVTLTKDEESKDIFGQVIGPDEIRKATEILQRYKAGKKNLETKIIEAEDWYKLRNWECMAQERAKTDCQKAKKEYHPADVKPTSAWMVNALLNRHADLMDNFPQVNFLPREAGDEDEAKKLSAIVPVILDMNDFESEYSEESTDKINAGTGAYGVFWDSSKLNGLGDISVVQVDILNLYWEPGIKDVQQSRNLFFVDLVDNEVLEEEHPELKNRLGSSSLTIERYNYDDAVDVSQKSAVVEWYYKKRTPEGKNVLHYVKYVNDHVLFATENETQPETDLMGNVIHEPMAATGLYDHGLYPFVLDPLYPVKGTPCGFGYVDIAKNPQEFVDRGKRGIMKNLLASANARMMARDGSINEAEYCDLDRDIVHVTGEMDDIQPLVTKPLSGNYDNIINETIDEIKETTGNRDVSTGGTGGVTAASGIAAMQEAGAKLPRDNIRGSYRAFRKVVLLVVELIRQFYDVPRQFRITGEDGSNDFVSYSNAGLKPVHQGVENGTDMGYRTPLFDVKIIPQKQSPYSKMAQNELALQLYQGGFFAPDNAVASLACLEMMDFDGKDKTMKIIQQNNTFWQAFVQMQAQLNAIQGALAMSQGMNPPSAPPAPEEKKGAPGAPAEDNGGSQKKIPSESSVTANARQKTAGLTSPT